MKNIGIVGGVGPLAGVDLHAKIIKNTKAHTDQEHLPIYHISCSHTIEDRTKYYLDNTLRNPALDIFAIIKQLHKLECKVIGIPCNSSHIHCIRSMLDTLVFEAFGNDIKVLHMIKEVAALLAKKNIKKVGLLATHGTCKSKLYEHILQEYNIELVIPQTEEQILKVHDSIYNKDYGIKAQVSPVHHKVKEILAEEANKLKRLKVEGIILGCTEIPLALSQDSIDVPLYDATEILARALIYNSNPNKLLQ